MAAQEADYAVLSEYCSRAEVTRARARFFQRRARLLLYTERAHFYNRFSLRGIRVRVRCGSLPPAVCLHPGLCMCMYMHLPN